MNSSSPLSSSSSQVPKRPKTPKPPNSDIKEYHPPKIKDRNPNSVSVIQNENYSNQISDSGGILINRNLDIHRIQINRNPLVEFFKNQIDTIYKTIASIPYWILKYIKNLLPKRLFGRGDEGRREQDSVPPKRVCRI